MSNETVPPDGEPDTAGIEAAKQAVYETMPVVLKDLVARSEAEAATGVPHGAGVPDRWLADVAVRAYLAAGRAAADEPWREAIAFINWFAEGPCGCDGDPQDPCDSCRALALLTRLDDLAGRAAASPDPPRFADPPNENDTVWMLFDAGGNAIASRPGPDAPAASPDERLREVNDLRDQVQMYEEKAERDWRDFGEMQDARIAADDRVVELEKELARVCKQLDSANDMVERAWSLTAGAMSGNPHRPTANTEWMDAAHAWEHDYCMGQGTLGGES